MSSNIEDFETFVDDVLDLLECGTAGPPNVFFLHAVSDGHKSIGYRTRSSNEVLEHTSFIVKQDQMYRLTFAKSLELNITHVKLVGEENNELIDLDKLILPSDKTKVEYYTYALNSNLEMTKTNHIIVLERLPL